MKYCERFYEYLYIDHYDGRICLCPWMEPEKAYIGNLMTEDIDSAYNSEYANYLRSTMDDQSFTHCRKEACPYLQNKNLPDITLDEYNSYKKTRYYPTNINLAYDFVCNQSCETCRKTVFTPPPDYAKQLAVLQEKLELCLNSAKIISASGHGDPFASKYMMAVLEKLRPKNPDLQILLETNGVFFDEAHWKRINHLAACRLEIVLTSNSLDKYTYNLISRGGNYKKLIQNMAFISQLRNDGKISVLSHSFVIQDRNFREIPAFIKRSLQDYAFDSVVLKPVYQWGTMDEDVYWFKDVLNPCHPYHAEYLEIMQDPALNDPRVYHFGGSTLHEARPYPGSGSGVTFPFSCIKNSSKVVLYGAGQVGQAYMRQLEETDFCRVVLWLDKNGDGCRVMTPDAVSALSPDDYDYIVLAVKSPIHAEEMKIALRDSGVPEDRIVCCI